MKIKWIILTFIQLFLLNILTAQTYALIDKESLTLNNGIIKRVVKFNTNNAGIFSKGFEVKLNKLYDGAVFEICKIQ